MKLDKLKAVIRSLVTFSETEVELFLKQCEVKTYSKNSVFLSAGEVCNQFIFLNKGLCRTIIVDSRGTEHTTLFGMEGDFVADYSSYLKERPSTFTIQTIERCEAVVIPRETIELAFQTMTEGNKLGRLLIERYYVTLQELMEMRRTKEPLELFKHLNLIYPGIHQRVPQNIIASFVGISAVHLSRLKSKDAKRNGN